ncbi:MAG: hypothetical protein ACT6FF_09835, partial [Methanosarcinaceae archaeon]
VDIKSPQKVYKILRDGIIGKWSLKETGEDSVTLAQVQSQQKKILKLFQSESIVKKYLNTIGINTQSAKFTTKNWVKPQRRWGAGYRI